MYRLSVRILGFAAFASVLMVIAAFVFTNNSYVRTPSMYPTIPPGSQVFLDKSAQYKPGDVIEFKGNGLTWVHRLVKINPDGTIVTKGDNPENAPDAFVPALTTHDIMGKVTGAPKWVGFPQLIAQHPSEGLGWLRAELGLTGKILVLAVVAALTISVLRRRKAEPTPRHAVATS